ncbi:Rsp5p-dependent ubiquitination, sorting of cargo proteins at the multivesicular body [Aspergillus fumigatus]|nr:Rsp5p-dependent ubiquitination, sorting of cargo proteins at the multivesicular body [Aspergillus fumigatus]
MRGSEASGPGAIFGAPSTLTTSVIRNPTSFLSSSTPLPSTDADVIAQNVEHVLLSLTSHNDGGLVGVSGNSSGSTGKGILIGVLSAFGSATVAVLVLAIFFFFKYTRRGRIFLDRIGRPGEFDDEQAFAREEAEALEVMDDMARSEYMRAKSFVEANPPESMQTDISLSQFLAIQEKGVSAWEFQPELEIANCFVEGRTEIEFYDSECSVQTNLPVPKQNDVYYWEAKIYEKPESTLISIGMTTKPYPLFRLPGMSMSEYSTLVLLHSCCCSCCFFTRNGKKLEDVVHGAKTQNFFPTVGANGPCTVHVNFGQMGFVFIEANVKKWGLAPMTGSLAPPPPYGSEQGSILLESGRESAAQISQRVYQDARTSSTVRIPPSRSPGPVRSPTDISLAPLAHIPSHEDVGEGSSHANTIADEQTALLNPTDLDQVPPPEYSSPDGSRRGSDITGDLPNQSSPPIPSYDAAVGNQADNTLRPDGDH